MLQQNPDLIPTKTLLLFSLPFLIVFMFAGESMFYLAALNCIDRDKINRVRKLYKLAIYVIMIAYFIGILML